MALLRAMESERSDALFRDPYARLLVGDRADAIMKLVRESKRFDPRIMAVRTHLLDQNILELIRREGVDTVVNLAAGLDSRPYRLDLPASLYWVEVDLPGILSEKEKVLALEKPKCRLERIKQDLRDLEARHALFTRLNASAGKALILTEGLLMYLPPDDVKALARELHEHSRFQFWLMDLLSPFELHFIQKKHGDLFANADAKVYFGPAEGPEFFRPSGWEPVRYFSFVKEASRLKRDSWPFRIVRWLSPVLPAKFIPRYGIAFLKRGPSSD